MHYIITSDLKKKQENPIIMLKFPLNSNSWGPMDANAAATKFRDIPYSPFNKADKLGRVADFYAAEQQMQEQYQQQDTSQPPPHTSKPTRSARVTDQAFGAGLNSAFSGFNAHEEMSFSVVDRAIGSAAATPVTANTPRTPWGTTNAAGAQGTSSAKGARSTMAGSTSGGKATTAANVRLAAQQQKSRWGVQQQTQQRPREPSVAVQPSWTLVEEYQLSAFQKLSSEVVVQAVSQGQYGRVGVYDKTFDRVSSKADKPLRTSDTPVVIQTSAKDDPILKKTSETLVLPGGKRIQGDLVLATSQVMAALMTAPRSINGWDVVVTKTTVTDNDGAQHRVITFDKRDKSTLDQPGVYETSNEQPHEVDGDKKHSNSPAQLQAEAVLCDQTYRQNVLVPKKVHELENPNPFTKRAQTLEGFQYSSFELKPVAEGVTPITLLARTDLHAVAPGSTPTKVALYALAEYFPYDAATGAMQATYTSWKQRIDTSRGSILATEIRNNNNKLAKWTVEAILSGAEQIKFGYVTRKIPLNPARGHTLVGTQLLRPAEFSKQLSLTMESAWGIFKSLVEIFLKNEDGRYLLLKDANLPKVSLYNTGFDTIPGFDAPSVVPEIKL